MKLHTCRSGDVKISNSYNVDSAYDEIIIMIDNGFLMINTSRKKTKKECLMKKLFNFAFYVAYVASLVIKNRA